MASALAIASRALFETMVPEAAALGTVEEGDRYASANKAFDGSPAIFNLDDEGGSGDFDDD